MSQTRCNGTDGNCFEACVATVLGLSDIEEVPRYIEGNDQMNGYLLRLDEWLRERGKSVLAIHASDDYPYDDKPDAVGPDALWIGLFATTPGADYHHAVVMRGRTPIWDPQPGQFAAQLRAPLRCVILVVDRAWRGSEGGGQPSSE